MVWNPAISFSVKHTIRSKMMLLPFDAHNHVHLCTNPQALTNLVSGDGSLDGMAVMSTHPRDFDVISSLSEQKRDNMNIVPCFGVHPWFIHELEEVSNNDDELEDSIVSHLEAFPNAIVGEIGLDGHRYNPDTGELVTPMERQVSLFELQMKIATRFDRPVSLHAVLCWGPFMKSLSKLKKNHGLPPTLYFHAFGGKEGTVDQLLALCRGRQAYFGFAPCINFRSPKTAQVMRKIGLHRLVLETDRENAALVREEIGMGIDMIAKALDVSKQEVVEQTTANSRKLYRL